MNRSNTARRLLASAAALTAMAIAPMAAAEVPNPSRVWLVPANAAPGDASHDYPWMATIHPIEQAGYVEEEFFYEGMARSFETRGDDAGKVNGEHPYVTRMIVRRPADMSDFNGVVLAEWQNVTAGYDLDAMWGGSYEHIIREGYVWVGISAQRVGIQREPNGLVQWSPTRYGDLDVTDGGEVEDDSLSYDIFAQGMEAIRDPQGTNVLGGAVPETIIAMGASQSAGRLGGYINALHDELGDPVDAYFLMIGGGTTPTDLDVPVFKMLTETDVPGQVRSRMPDSDNFRLWEVSGASHSSRRTSMNAGPLTNRDGVERALAECELPTYPRVPTNYVLGAAYDHITAWAQDGTPPPIAPRMEIDDEGAIVRDEHGNGLGGIRLAEFDPAVARNTGANTGSGFCRLYGSYEPFDDALLNDLYPTRGDYIQAAREQTEHNLEMGYIVAEDAAASNRRASHSIYGRGLDCDEACHLGLDLVDSAYFYLAIADRGDALITRLETAVLDVARGRNARAARGLELWTGELRRLEADGDLSTATVDALTSGAEGILAAMR